VSDLKEIRDQLHYSMSEMAEELQISKSVYQGYESGRRSAPPHTLEMAFAALQRNQEHKTRYEPGAEMDVFYQSVPKFMGEE
jgi:transcriptional regulator with XRE-family HTH domain